MDCLKDQFSNGIILDGRYETISPLNHGSFGMVFIARDLVTGDSVAIKCLTKRSAATECLSEFAIDDKSEEFSLHSRLGSHPNIVNLLRSFETDSHTFLVLEFCERGDLYEAIREGRGPLETEHVRQTMLEIVDAVSYIHSKGVYHRDIKPENIFLTQSGSPKLGDFGLATSDKWTMETTVGSDRYMSPEQYDSAGAGYSPAEADIWAIGVCLLNILFSRNPFTSPTESDPLFLDFSRDKQSLFDIFPSMSQDTYEVIVQCMNLDPRRRSLQGAREALLNVVSFTTTDETLDDFCSSEPRTCATANNREPLRTPSIQSPFVEQGAFPWAKALEATPRQPIRQLSAIPDYEEELFPKSEETSDWCSGTAQTPSVSSMLDSSLGGSMQSVAATRPPLRMGLPLRQQPAMPGSLPISMAKPKPFSAMSFAFGGRGPGAVSKSWSDLYDEDEEEEEQARQLETLKELNSRTWSHESLSAIAEDGGAEDKENNEPHGLSHNDVDDDFVADGFFFQDVPVPAKPESAPLYSPPPKRNNNFVIDKWAALGERRRGGVSGVEGEKVADLDKPRRQLGIGFNYGGINSWEHHDNHNNLKMARERAKGCPWDIGRDCNRRREKRLDLGDVEWVGTWPELHS
ncbi:related to serine/threonine-specific kinase KSP1 [Cephalotrichum gorgonifer]|uniref:Autophagy-related protein 1 n=1 Tax=Cephalotrichum gorgonifer TaxID=2041049 RepID=A0AAE8SS90_9PEZI|nr:related to serine/threonine-specific kinase KSP1 [Cephalotrichum gorgonifer]